MQIIGFGSAHFACQTHHPHPAGSQAIRSDPCDRVRSQRISSDAGSDDDLAGFKSNSAWSSDEHERYRPKQCGKRFPKKPLTEPRFTTQQVKQPERFNCPNIPGYEGVESWEETIADEFSLFTGGLEYAEELVRKVCDAARQNKDDEDSAEWQLTFEEFACDHELYLLAM